MTRLTVVVILLLLASVGTASTQCAWMSWAWRDGPQPGNGYVNSQYHPLETFQFGPEGKKLGLSGKGACENARNRYKPRDGWPRFVCLPDTVDPRGPKGN